MPDPLSHQRDILRRIAARLTARRRGCRVPSLVLMTDDARAVDWVEAVRALPRGSAVIVRARDPKRREDLTKRVQRVAKPRGVLTLVAEDAKLAMRARADGLHCPEKQVIALAGLKRTLPRMLMTASAHGATGLVLAARSGVDAALLSPLFSTRSHPDATALGPLRWALIRQASKSPVLALGGLSAANGLRAAAAGADGLALIGAWVGAS